MDIPPPERSSLPTVSPPMARLVLALAGALVFGVGLFFADAHGAGGLYEWSILFAAGTGLAIALFWGRRKAGWFWPTVSLIVAAHLVALAALKWRLFPTGEAAQFGSAPYLKGAVGLDFAVSALIMYIVHGLVDRDGFTRTRPGAVAKTIKLGFALLVLTIPIVITLLVMQARQSKIAALRVVFTQETTRTTNTIIYCLEPNSARGAGWQDVTTPSPAKEFFDAEWERRFRVVERGARRQVEVATVQGRQLSAEERQLLASCLVPPVD